MLLSLLSTFKVEIDDVTPGDDPIDIKEEGVSVEIVFKPSDLTDEITVGVIEITACAGKCLTVFLLMQISSMR